MEHHEFDYDADTIARSRAHQAALWEQRQWEAAHPDAVAFARMGWWLVKAAAWVVGALLFLSAIG